jgi:predicted NBD/HSP70 family sugar kinase
LGGTKIEGVVLGDPDMLQPIARIRIETQAQLGYEHVLTRIRNLLTELEAESGCTAIQVGIGTPGSRSPATGLMRNANTTCLNGRPMLQDLESRLGREVRMANDANCFALAEARWGAGRGFPTVFGVIMGTGVGGGIVVEGKVLEGANGIAGEWGHIVLDPDGPPCYCGRNGCIETYLSGPANEAEYAVRTGGRLAMSEIASRAARGEAAAVEQIELLCRRFGRALGIVVNMFDPDVIVLGGGLGQIEALSSSGRAQIAKWVFGDVFSTPLLHPRLGDSAGVFGAALLAAT